MEATVMGSGGLVLAPKRATSTTSASLRLLKYSCDFAAMPLMMGLTAVILTAMAHFPECEQRPA